MEYAYWNTWDTETIQWATFQGVSNGTQWGIYEAISFTIVPEPETFLFLLVSWTGVFMKKY
jgi:hypothetical protein